MSLRNLYSRAFTSPHGSKRLRKLTFTQNNSDIVTQEGNTSRCDEPCCNVTPGSEQSWADNWVYMVSESQDGYQVNKTHPGLILPIHHCRTVKPKRSTVEMQGGANFSSAEKPYQRFEGRKTRPFPSSLDNKQEKQKHTGYIALDFSR